MPELDAERSGPLVRDSIRGTLQSCTWGYRNHHRSEVETVQRVEALAADPRPADATRQLDELRLVDEHRKRRFDLQHVHGGGRHAWRVLKVVVD